MVNIILCMIVKNESKIISRCVDSCSEIVDCISIVDTGSTDNTVEILLNYNGKVYQKEWVNFGINRTHSFQKCVETAQLLGYKLEESYALLLDADMELVIDSGFKKQELTAISYSIKQKSGISYYNTRLIRLDQNIACVGVTHEYWNTQASKLNTLSIRDLGDGGCKQDKFERDIKLLEQGLIDEPLNSRYMFYLAQSYKDTRNTSKAVEMYRKHISCCTWNEEKWYSMLKIGILLSSSEWLLKAFEFRPSRAEPLYYLSKICREAQNYNLAYMYSEFGSKIPYPSNDVLFIEDDIYNYGFLSELSISAYYTPFKNKGLTMCKTLLDMDIPIGTRQMVLNNIKFYTENKLYQAL